MMENSSVTQEVVFLMSGAAHAPYLVVALDSLRRHYAGKVVVYAYPESHGVISRIAGDTNLRIEARLWNPSYRGKNSQFLNKIQMMQQIDSDVGLYLDADTMVCGSIDQLFELSACGFVATQFNDWKTNGGVIKNRILRLMGRIDDYDGLCDTAVKKLITDPYQSVNGGVFAARKDSIVLPIWEQWTKRVIDIFIADETVLHLISHIFGKTRDVCIAEGGMWNCSPKHKPSGLNPIIWHFHGDSNVRPNKSEFGFNLWWPEFTRCLENNVGFMRDWIDTIDNKYLNELRSTEAKIG